MRIPEFDKATAPLREFRGDAYCFGMGVLADVGTVAARLGKKAALVRGTFTGSDDYVESISHSMKAARVELAAEIRGARPNSPREDVLRIADALRQAEPDVIVSFGGGSTIDAVKAADVVQRLGGDVEDYFGTHLVSDALQSGRGSLTPHVAVQTVAGSAAHLTKYSNVTDLATGQKKLIVDDAIVPPQAIFDYAVTCSAPASLTADGALDGLSHMLEVLYGAVGKPHYDKAAEIASTGHALVLEYLPRAIENPADREAREALCLATDLGGYAIMIGGTNGAHLTSFSLVDILSHGRACALMNPYYTVFFAPAVQEPLRLIGAAYQRAGYIPGQPQGVAPTLHSRDLGVAVANGMFAFARKIGLPTKLTDVSGFGQVHIDRALTAAKNPQLRMKLENMPVALTADMVDEYMGPVLAAARDGDLSGIRNVAQTGGRR
ncbi:MAG: iron-containing alcohol dehydrogenase [Sedimentisphaerales bacterium]|nr:iron-containing alcohol dehydrogenase [Sedimentisphaerales bacterium]